MAASIQASRFALLNLDGSSDEDGKSKNQKGGAAKANGSAKRKKSNKKKQSSAASADLRNLAFGGGKTGGNQGQSQKPVQQQHSSPPSHQYETWVEQDQGMVDELFQKELQQAILLSKVDSEKQTAERKTTQEENQNETDTSGSKKKKKNKNKAKTISMDEFQNGPAQPEEKGDHYLDKRKISGSGDNFFNSVESGVAQIVRKDKLQEEYQKQYKVQSVLQAKHTQEMETKDETIEKLRKEVTESQEELKTVKKRNKQLCFILGQGEMKEKAEILQQVDSLTQIKDELTSQVTSLTTELEKERSKVHTLLNDAKAKKK